MSRNRINNKHGIESKFYVYIVTLVIFGSLGLFLWLFGLDLGFVKIEGKANSSILLILFILGLFVEYVIDIKYCKILKKYTGDNESLIDYVPYINTILGMNKVIKAIMFILMGYLLISIIIIFTPILKIFPSNLILNMSKFLVNGIVMSVLLLIIFRGYDQQITKKYILIDCEKLSGENGAGGKFSNVIQIVLYYFPILRVSSLIQDIQLTKTVCSLIDLNKDLEGSDN